MNLYLVRHGEAAGGESDPGLSRRGIDEARAVGRWLRDHARADPARILHSTKRRARETAEIVAEALGNDAERREVRGLSPADPTDDLAAELLHEAEDLVVVSHLPFLEYLGAQLLTGNPAAGFLDLPTAGVLGLVRREWRARDGETRRRFSLGCFVTPEIIG